MEQLAETREPESTKMDDLEVVRRVLDGELDLYEIIMRRYNQRLFRVAFSILRDAAEAEDVIQEAYLKAFHKLDQFEGRAAFSTWLTKIAVHEALHRRRRRVRLIPLDAVSGPQPGREKKMKKRYDSPEKETLRGEVRLLLEKTIMQMPANYRTVFVLRKVESLSTAETAALLGISEPLVKTRLHRARAWLQDRVLLNFNSSRGEILQFAGESCDRVVHNVMSMIESTSIKRSSKPKQQRH